MFIPMLEALSKKLTDAQEANVSSADTPVWFGKFELEAIVECIQKAIDQQKHDEELVQDMHDYDLMITRAFLEREVRRYERGFSDATAGG